MYLYTYKINLSRLTQEDFERRRFLPSWQLWKKEFLPIQYWFFPWGTCFGGQVLSPLARSTTCDRASLVPLGAVLYMYRTYVWGEASTPDTLASRSPRVCCSPSSILHHYHPHMHVSSGPIVNQACAICAHFSLFRQTPGGPKTRAYSFSKLGLPCTCGHESREEDLGPPLVSPSNSTKGGYMTQKLRNTEANFRSFRSSPSFRIRRSDIFPIQDLLPETSGENFSRFLFKDFL